MGVTTESSAQETFPRTGHVGFRTGLADEDRAPSVAPHQPPTPALIVRYTKRSRTTFLPNWYFASPAWQRLKVRYT